MISIRCSAVTHAYSVSTELLYLFSINLHKKPTARTHPRMQTVEKHVDANAKFSTHTNGFTCRPLLATPYDIYMIKNGPSSYSRCSRQRLAAVSHEHGKGAYPVPWYVRPQQHISGIFSAKFAFNGITTAFQAQAINTLSQRASWQCPAAFGVIAPMTRRRFHALLVLNRKKSLTHARPTVIWLRRTWRAAPLQFFVSS